MKKIIIFLLVVVISYAETTSYGRVCLTESEHKEFAVGDSNVRKHLLANGRCFYIKSGLSCVTLDRGWLSGRNKIKIFEGSQAYVVYGYLDVCKP